MKRPETLHTDPAASGPNEGGYTAFAGVRRLAVGALADVARVVAEVNADGAQGPFLVFEDATGRVVDLDLRGAPDAVAARYASPAAARTTPDVPASRPPGRPKLGVVAREVTLLPRQWDWLATQPGGASATLRRLVDAARASGGAAERARRAREAAYNVMHAFAGDWPHFEDASRALFAADRAGFRDATAHWPHDVRAHLDAMAFDSTDESPPR